MYTLMEKRNGVWIRSSSYAYLYKIAIRLFHDTIVDLQSRGVPVRIKAVRQ